MKFEKLIHAIEEIAPESSQESWDNSGVQILVRDGEITGVLIALEITDEIIEEAKDMEVELIITHHPLIFGDIRSINRKSISGQYIIELISAGISVYSSHTPFDKAAGGNNDYLAELLGLENVTGFQTEEGMDMLGRTGFFKENLSLNQVIRLIEQKLEIPRSHIRSVGEQNEIIKKAAICTGAGADYIGIALENDCDLLITGDLKYHDAQNAKAAGLCVIDAGHFGTEKFFVPNFARLLRSCGEDSLRVIEATSHIDPFSDIETIKR